MTETPQQPIQLRSGSPPVIARLIKVYRAWQMADFSEDS